MDDHNSTISINNRQKIYWACRRGMLELDVILNKFLEGAYADLPDAEKELFIKLLAQTDPDLFSWLLGHDEPSDPTLKHIVIKVRDYVRGHHT